MHVKKDMIWSLSPYLTIKSKKSAKCLYTTELNHLSWWLILDTTKSIMPALLKNNTYIKYKKITLVTVILGWQRELANPHQQRIHILVQREVDHIIKEMTLHILSPHFNHESGTITQNYLNPTIISYETKRNIIWITSQCSVKKHAHECYCVIPKKSSLQSKRIKEHQRQNRWRVRQPIYFIKRHYNYMKKIIMK